MYVNASSHHRHPGNYLRFARDLLLNQPGPTAGSRMMFIQGGAKPHPVGMQTWQVVAEERLCITWSRASKIPLSSPLCKPHLRCTPGRYYTSTAV